MAWRYIGFLMSQVGLFVSNFEYKTIKRELQGGCGLIKEVRGKYLPSTMEMSRLAQKKFEEECVGSLSVDDALNRLLCCEYEMYLERQQLVNDNFIDYADKIANMESYPVTRSVIDDYKKLCSKTDSPESILGGVTKIITALADSNRQSRVSRSGSSLMHHIAYLLSRHGFESGVHFKREFVLSEDGSGCKLDFFFPGLSEYQHDPINCCSVACQTTSNDRFRLTFAQMPSSTRNRACTAIGCENFGDKLGPDSLTDNKLAEAKENKVKFVILETAIDDRLRDSKTVMSYQEWFEELETLKSFWKTLR